MKDDGARDFRSRPGLSASPGPPESPAIGEHPLGEERWETLSELGVGGMGRIDLVADRWLDRSVAVKRPLGEGDAQRLWREALITARLEHPGIVPVYDVGLTAAGAPWFAMRVVRGQSLGKLISQTAAWSGRLALLRHVLAACEAVGYANKRGIVHRDLKPDNVMVGAFGETQVIDWGLALVADPRGLPAGVDPARAGTPGYMSPEQTRGETLDARTDVYSLGALLFELVTGTPPGRGSLAELCPDAPAELSTIVARAMASDTAERYPDAKALALDLAAYLDGRRVGAHQYSPRELLGRLVRAWRLPLAISTSALVAIGVLTALGVARISAERNQAEANLALSFLAEAQRALTELRLGEAEVLATAALERSRDATLSAEARGVLVALGATRPGRVEHRAPPCRPAAVAGTRALCVTPESLFVYQGDELLWTRLIANRGAGFVAGGDALVVLGELLEGTSHRAWLDTLDARTGLPLGARRVTRCPARLDPGFDGSSVLIWSTACAERVTLSEIAATPPDVCPREGLMLAADRQRAFVAACNDGTLTVGSFGAAGVQRLDAGLGTFASPPLTTALAYLGAEQVLVGASDGSLLSLAFASPRTHVPLGRQKGRVRHIAVSPDEHLAVVLADESAPLVIDLRAGTELLRLPEPAVSAADFAPDGTLALVGRRSVSWDLAGVQPRSRPFTDGVAALALSRDGTLVGVAHGATVTLMSLPDGAILRRERWQESVIKGLAFDPQERLVAHGMGSARVVRFGRAGPLQDDPPREATPWRRMVMLAGGAVLTSGWGPLQALLRPDHAAEIVAQIPLVDIAASADGRSLALLTQAGEFQCARDFETSRSFVHCGVDRAARVLAVPDEAHVLAGGSGGVNAWHVGPDGQTLEVRYEAPGVEVTALAAGHGYVAAGARDGSVWWWREGQASALSITRTHSDRVGGLAFGPEAAWLLSGGWDGRVDILKRPDTLGTTHDEARRAWGLTLSDTFGRPGVALD